MKRDVRTIQLTKGMVAIVDAEDYPYLSRFKWHAVKCKNGWYAHTQINGRRKLMHRLILGSLRGDRTDHRDGNGLNNRRDNIRKCSVIQNARGYRTLRSSKPTPYRGVTLLSSGKWQAKITVCGSEKYLGSFKDDRSAAMCYDVAARRHFGEFASPNFTA